MNTSVFHNSYAPTKPGVLCVAGLDPSGGAGLVADIEVCAAMGAHAFALNTANTAQDSHNLQALWPTPVVQLDLAARVLLADIAPSAIKLGLLASLGQLDWLARLLPSYPDIPLVWDPILRAGGGTDFPAGGWSLNTLAPLLARCALITPNLDEALRLTKTNSADAAAAMLMTFGARAVLITGGDACTERVINCFYTHGHQEAFPWPRWPQRYRGAGCTLATAIAVGLAAGQDLRTAVVEGDAYTHAALGRATAMGRGRLRPGRGA